MTFDDYLDTLAEPKREVLKRISFAMGPISISSFEPKLVAAGLEIVAEGWLTDGGSYHCGGRTYQRLEPDPRMVLAAVKGRWGW